MQVDTIKPTLKAPGIKLLKVKYVTPLSDSAVKFNLRRYNPPAGQHDDGRVVSVFVPGQLPERRAGRLVPVHGRVVQLHPIKPTLKAPGTERVDSKMS